MTGPTHDPLLAQLISARDDATREQALAELLERARPLVARIVGGRTGGALSQEDRDDAAATVRLRLIERLLVPESIESFDDYVATLAHNALYDVLRMRFPNRTRLKNRLRYVLTRDERFALWPTPAGMVAGLRAWHGSLEVGSATSAINAKTAEQALTTVFRATGRPLLFDDLVDAIAAAWQVTDAPSAALDASMPAPAMADAIESRELLEALWDEILQLRPQQRAALLLNLRDGGGTNVIAHFVLAGITTLDKLAATLLLTTQQLAELWSQLPLDDLTIAGLLGVERQKVINLRQAARQRLARRLRQ